jgi:hypothetical protein
MSDDRRRRRRPRRPATAAERRQAREVAAFVHVRGLGDQPLLVTMALVSRAFPGIKLDNALVGVVFRKLLITPPALALADLPARGCA